MLYINLVVPVILVVGYHGIARPARLIVQSVLHMQELWVRSHEEWCPRTLGTWDGIKRQGFIPGIAFRILLRGSDCAKLKRNPQGTLQCCHCHSAWQLHLQKLAQVTFLFVCRIQVIPTFSAYVLLHLYQKVLLYEKYTNFSLFSLLLPSRWGRN